MGPTSAGDLARRATDVVRGCPMCQCFIATCRLLNKLQPGLVAAKYEVPASQPFKQVRAMTIFYFLTKTFIVPMLIANGGSVVNIYVSVGNDWKVS